jgi:hypothetical protein
VMPRRRVPLTCRDVSPIPDAKLLARQLMVLARGDEYGIGSGRNRAAERNYLGRGATKRAFSLLQEGFDLWHAPAEGAGPLMSDLVLAIDVTPSRRSTPHHGAYARSPGACVGTRRSVPRHRGFTCAPQLFAHTTQAKRPFRYECASTQGKRRKAGGASGS